MSLRSRRIRRWGAVVAVAVAGSVVATSTGQAASKTSSTPKSGGEVKYAIDNNIGSTSAGAWCFQNALQGGPLGVTRMVFESLVERDSRGRFIPHLAKSWSSSQGYKVWTFKLRTGIKFSNGEEFNADIAKLNIDIGSGAAIIDAATNKSSLTGIVTTSKYASFRGTGIGVNANILKVEAPSADTLVITLDKPSNEFIGLMYRAGRYVMRAREQIESPSTCPFKGIGTGPFTMESWTPDQTVLVKNPSYWRKDAKGRQLPYLDKITATTVKEGSQRAAALRKGTVDVAFFNVSDATFIKDMKKRKSLLTEFEGVPAQWGQWMPNQGKAGSPFVHKNCRIAVAHAIDWNTYNKVRLRGLGVVSGSIVGKDHIMFTTKGAYPYDVKKAQEYVAKCNTDLGSAAPFKVTLYADTTNQSLNNAKFLEEMMGKAGIQFNNTFQAESNFLISRIYNLAGNQYDFAQGTPAEGPGSGYVAPFFLSDGFPADSNSPIAASPFKFYGKIIALGNHTNTTYDGLVYAAMGETNKAKQSAAWKKSTEYLQSEAIAIPTLHSGTWTFVNKKSNLKGIGLFKNPDGKTFAPTKDIKGFEWTGIWKG